MKKFSRRALSSTYESDNFEDERELIDNVKDGEDYGGDPVVASSIVDSDDCDDRVPRAHDAEETHVDEDVRVLRGTQSHTC